MSNNPKTKADSEKKVATLIPAYREIKKQYEEWGMTNFSEYKKICQWLSEHEK
jgi:hypothetical protein